MSFIRPFQWRLSAILGVLLGVLPLARLLAQTPQDPGQAIQVMITVPAIDTQQPTGALKLEAVAVDYSGVPSPSWSSSPMVR